MSNILSIVALHRVKLDTAHQLSKNKNRIISFLRYYFDVHMKLGSASMNLLNRTGISNRSLHFLFFTLGLSFSSFVPHILLLASKLSSQSLKSCK